MTAQGGMQGERPGRPARVSPPEPARHGGAARRSARGSRASSRPMSSSARATTCASSRRSRAWAGACSRCDRPSPRGSGPTRAPRASTTATIGRCATSASSSSHCCPSTRDFGELARELLIDDSVRRGAAVVELLEALELVRLQAERISVNGVSHRKNLAGGGRVTTGCGAPKTAPRRMRRPRRR
jgi:hypothetical protein